MENETKIVRLTSHEEIIGRVTTTDTGVTIKDPLILIPTQQKSLALAPWMPYTTIATDCEPGTTRPDTADICSFASSS